MLAGKRDKQCTYEAAKAPTPRSTGFPSFLLSTRRNFPENRYNQHPANDHLSKGVKAVADFEDTQETSDDQSEQQNASSDTVDSSSSGDSSGAATDTAADSSTGTSSPVNIHYEVSLVAQPDDTTCWAASSAMILSYWHDVDTSSSNPSYSVQEIKDQVTSAGPQYDITSGLKPEDTQPVGDILGLSFDYPMCYGVDGFASL